MAIGRVSNSVVMQMQHVFATSPLAFPILAQLCTNASTSHLHRCISLCAIRRKSGIASYVSNSAPSQYAPPVHQCSLTQTCARTISDPPNTSPQQCRPTLKRLLVAFLKVAKCCWIPRGSMYGWRPAGCNWQNAVIRWERVARLRECCSTTTTLAKGPQQGHILPLGTRGLAAKPCQWSCPPPFFLLSLAWLK